MSTPGCLCFCAIMNLTLHAILLIILPVFVFVCVCACVSSFSAWGNKRNPLECNNASLKKGTVNKAIKVTQPVFSQFTHIHTHNDVERRGKLFMWI